MKKTAKFFTKTNSIRVAQRTCRTFAGSLLGITSLLVISSIFVDGMQISAKAQVTATPNDAGTVVNQDGNTFNIEGGTQAGSNLFHSLEKFGLNKDQIANFLSKPEIQNILGWITGGEASVINGLIKVTGGNSNLFLINPAGIIFGPNASLNVPAAFTATTANGIGFGDKWFNAVGTNDYTSLLGNPDAFAFTQPEAGAIINAGNLAVESGQNLTLLGGTVISTGTVSAPGGKVTIAAVPGEKLVRISQEGSVLSLDLPVETKAAINPPDFTPKSLPDLLTGGNLDGATGVSVENGVVKLTNSGVTIPNTPGTVVISSPIETQGGSVNILASNITVGDITTKQPEGNGGGSIILNAKEGDIKAGRLTTGGNSSSETISENSCVTQALRGCVDLRATGNIEVSWIDTSSSDKGGNIFIDAGRLFRATGSFSSNDFEIFDPESEIETSTKTQIPISNVPTSIDATGRTNGGDSISIKQGGNSFVIGPHFETDDQGNVEFRKIKTDEEGNRVRDDKGNFVLEEEPLKWRIIEDSGKGTVVFLEVDKEGNEKEIPNNDLVAPLSKPLTVDDVPPDASFTAGAITSNDSNNNLVTSYRDQSLSSEQAIGNGNRNGNGRITIVFSAPGDPKTDPKTDIKKFYPTNTDSTNTNSTNTDSTNTDSTNTEDSDKQSTQEQLNQPSQKAACQPSNTTLSLIQRLKKVRGIAINIPTSNTTDSCEEVIQGFDILRVIRDNRLKSVPGNLKIAPRH
jgi:filamentous hemagglutinin family protein